MSDDNVVFLPVETRLDLPPERVLEEALKSELECVVIIGFTKKADEFYFATSTPMYERTNYLLDLAKKDLLERATT